jgi:hypothetical protein
MTKPKETETSTPVTGLPLLRVPFPAHQIKQLPRGGGVSLSYVGHAALTDRLLDADLEWNWEPLALTTEGLPQIDEAGGLWIKLTICGLTRLGYGHAGSKQGGDAVKELIGDALRNAAMRFGAALDLWHKGDLHVEAQGDTGPPPAPEGYEEWLKNLGNSTTSLKTLLAYWGESDQAMRAHCERVNLRDWEKLKNDTAAKDRVAVFGPPPVAKKHPSVAAKGRVQ